MSLAVILPTFNEADNVEVLVHGLETNLIDVDAELLFVDDSTDNTPQVIGHVAATSLLPVRLLHRQTPDGGLSGAILAGLRATTAEWVIVMDADLQHPPEFVPVLYRQALSGDYDLVGASRYLPGGSSAGLGNRFRRIISVSSGRTAKMLFPCQLADCTDPMSGFFIVRRSALKLDEINACGYKVLLALLLHRDLTVSEVPFHFAARHAGESKASFHEGLRYLKLLALLHSQLRRRTSV